MTETILMVPCLEKSSLLINISLIVLFFDFSKGNIGGFYAKNTT